MIPPDYLSAVQPLMEDRGPPQEAALPPPAVGIVGLDHMGTAFALSLIADGYRVLAYDRNPAHVATLRRAGAVVLPSLDGVSVCNVVLTSLPDDEALKAVTFDGLVRVMPRGAVHVSMSTISPGLSRQLAAEHELHGQHYVAAPVLGNPDRVGARRLFVLAGGRSTTLDKVRTILVGLAEGLFVVSEDPAAANLMNLAGNVLIATTLQGMAEVLTLVGKGGVDRQAAFEILTNSLFDSKVHRKYGAKIVDQRYSPAGMIVPIALKNLRLALSEAENEGVPMPVASLVRDRLVGLLACGWADLDWSALGLLEDRDAGLLGSPSAGAATRTRP